MSDEDRILPEGRARDVWRRAAELQAEAARRAEARTRLLAGGDDRPARPDGFSLAEVRAAALEAGIGPEFVARALAEAEDGGWLDTALTPEQDRLATRLLGTEDRRLERHRLAAAPPRAVLEAMQRVLPAHPYFLALRDTLGDDPLSGAPLVFAAPEFNASNTNALAQTSAALDVQAFTFAVRPADEGRRAELSVSADLRRSARRSAKATLWVAGISGGGVAAGGAAVGVALLPGVLAAAPAVAALALGGWGAAKLMGVAYRSQLRKLERLLDEVLRAVDVHARTGGAFSPPSPPRAPGDDGGATLAAIGVFT